MTALGVSPAPLTKPSSKLRRELTSIYASYRPLETPSSPETLPVVSTRSTWTTRLKGGTRPSPFPTAAQCVLPPSFPT